MFELHMLYFDEGKTQGRKTPRSKIIRKEMKQQENLSQIRYKLKRANQLYDNFNNRNKRKNKFQSWYLFRCGLQYIKV